MISWRTYAMIFYRPFLICNTCWERPGLSNINLPNHGLCRHQSSKVTTILAPLASISKPRIPRRSSARFGDATEFFYCRHAYLQTSSSSNLATKRALRVVESLTAFLLREPYLTSKRSRSLRGCTIVTESTLGSPDHLLISHPG